MKLVKAPGISALPLCRHSPENCGFPQQSRLSLSGVRQTGERELAIPFSVVRLQLRTLLVLTRAIPSLYLDLVSVLMQIAKTLKKKR